MTFVEVANDPNVELAMSIAKAAGEQLLVRPEHLKIDTKSSATDVVTQMDFAGGRLDRGARRREGIVRAVHATLGGRLLVLLDGHC